MTGEREVNTMIFAFIIALYGIASMFDLLEEITVAFAPVINSGSGVLAYLICAILMPEE